MQDHSESRPKFILYFKSLYVLLRLVGLEVPRATESLEIWSSCPDGVYVQHPLNKWQR